MHICVDELGHPHQAIFCINAAFLSIGPIGTNFSLNRNTKIFIEDNTFENFFADRQPFVLSSMC